MKYGDSSKIYIAKYIKNWGISVIYNTVRNCESVIYNIRKELEIYMYTKVLQLQTSKQKQKLSHTN